MIYEHKSNEFYTSCRFTYTAQTSRMSVEKMKHTFYLSHGSPTLAIDETLPVRHFFKSWSENKKIFDQKPKSILVISAHWETHQPCVTSVDHCDTIYDYHGFPAATYQIKYPVPGAPDLAKRVHELITASGMGPVHIENRGLDHGAWIPLMLMYPEAKIPVCQLSVQKNKDATHHYNIGKALAPLKEEGVLIIGSGTAVHNLSSVNWDAKDHEVALWAAEFDKWLEQALIAGRHEDVKEYLQKAPNAKMAHPTPDHFHPLHVALGAAGENMKAELIHRSWILGTISYASYKFTTPD